MQREQRPRHRRRARSLRLVPSFRAGCRRHQPPGHCPLPEAEHRRRPQQHPQPRIPAAPALTLGSYFRLLRLRVFRVLPAILLAPLVAPLCRPLAPPLWCPLRPTSRGLPFAFLRLQRLPRRPPARRGVLLRIRPPAAFRRSVSQPNPKHLKPEPRGAR
eukprot:1192108-Prorocentrum_minimum.AAC.2